MEGIWNSCRSRCQTVITKYGSYTIVKVHALRVTTVNYDSTDTEDCKKGLLEKVTNRSCDQCEVRNMSCDKYKFDHCD